MASKINLAPLPQFDPLEEPSSLSRRWIAGRNDFKHTWKHRILKKTSKKEHYYFGEATQEIFETSSDTSED